MKRNSMRIGHVHDYYLTFSPFIGLIWVCKICGKTKKFEGLNDLILKAKMNEKRLSK